jgi:heme/copper-type cytochrome/quinol oxidase subunit 4
MILLHLKHLYNTNENFNTTDDSDADAELVSTTNDKSETISGLSIMFIFIIIIISCAAFYYSFTTNRKENQPILVSLCCAFNAAYFNIFYFMYLKWHSLSTKSSFRYVEFTKDFIDNLGKKTSNNYIPRIIVIEKSGDIKLNFEKT